MFVIRTDYYVNIVAISKKLCVNQAKPKMHCNGKCYLAKQINEKEKQEQQAPESKKGKLEINVFIAAAQPLVNLFRQPDSIAYNTLKAPGIVSFPRPVFHPPTA